MKKSSLSTRLATANRAVSPTNFVGVESVDKMIVRINPEYTSLTHEERHHLSHEIHSFIFGKTHDLHHDLHQHHEMSEYLHDLRSLIELHQMQSAKDLLHYEEFGVRHFLKSNKCHSGH